MLYVVFYPAEITYDNFFKLLVPIFCVLHSLIQVFPETVNTVILPAVVGPWAASRVPFVFVSVVVAAFASVAYAAEPQASVDIPPAFDV